MGAADYGGNGFKGRARASGERPMGAARCRQQHNQASCQPLLPPGMHWKGVERHDLWGARGGEIGGLHSVLPLAFNAQRGR